MNPTMNITGEFVFFWYVIAPTLILFLTLALSLTRKLGRQVHEVWKRLREAWHLRPLQHRGSPSSGTPGR